MAYLNVSAPADFVKLQISSVDGSFTGATDVITVPSLQDITVTNSNGIFRWVQLDSTSRKAVATPATNSLNFNIVLDDASFFTGSGATLGILALSNNKTKIYFKFTFGGGTAHTMTGVGYITGLAPKVTPDAPVFITPITIEVDGNFTVA